jgi:5-methyltetrahydrofolate--homocysteine methyltransferase
VGPLAVLAGVTGEQHGLGLACLDQVLRDQGWSVANLGPDVPPADLARFLARNHADLLALSASLPDREPAVRDAVAAARAARADAGLAIMLGGALAADAVVAERLDVDFAADSLVAAAGFARTVADGLSDSDPALGPAGEDSAG